MSDSAWPDDTDALSAILVRGISRQSVALPEPFASTGEDTQHLALLAALAVRLRFTPPDSPVKLTHQPAIHENITPVIGVLRSELVRYFSRQSRTASDLAITRIFTDLKSRDLHVHPFDYIAMRSVVQPHTSHLMDTAFLSWCRRGSKKANSGGAVKASKENWIDFPISARCNFIADLHRRESQAARELLAEHIAAETAANRSKLIDCLADALTTDDIEFLQSFEQDRSKSVKESVERLLSTLPGTVQNATRLEEAQSRLIVKIKKFTGTKTITVDKPKHIKGYELDRWYEATFANIAPEQLISPLELQLSEFIKSLKDAHLASYCFEFFAKSDNVKHAKQILKEFDSVAPEWMDNPDFHTQQLSDEMNDVCWSVYINYALSNSVWDWCERVINYSSVLLRPMPESLAKKLLKDKQLKAGLSTLEKRKQHYDGALLEVLVCLLPSSSYEELYSRLEGVSPMLASPAKQLMNLITLVENSTGVKPSN